MLQLHLKQSKPLSYLAKTLLLLTLITAGCSNPFKTWSPQLENTVDFDDNFSSEEKTAIMDGFNLWHESFGNGVGFSEVKGGAIKIHKATDEDMAKFDKQEAPKKPAGLSHFYDDNKSIYFMFQRITNLKYLKLVAAHEGGHHLGMGHIPQEQTAIMNPSANLSIINDPHITKYDAVQFCDHWGCND